MTFSAGSFDSDDDYLYFVIPSRNAIHVGNKTYSDVNEEVYGYLKNDIPKSVKPWLETLLNNDYKVMIYRYLHTVLNDCENRENQ